MEYKPQLKTQTVLDWCLTRVNSVPFKVTARWLFYRYVEEVLKAEGMTTKQAKKQYKTFLQWTSRARKRFYNGWNPNTLVDDTREAHLRGYGYYTEKQWLEHFKKEECLLDKHPTQDKVVEIWFEAAAMYSQFAHYTRPYYITLRPFKGDPSIAYKWSIAQWLKRLAHTYEKPIIILYFGDFDEKGMQIPLSAVKDIKTWSNTDFEYVRCGINKEQVVDWGILESFDKGGTYQWEALSEDKAKALIIENIEKYWSLDKVRKVEEKEKEAAERWKELISSALEN